MQDTPTDCSYTGRKISAIEGSKTRRHTPFASTATYVPCSHSCLEKGPPPGPSNCSIEVTMVMGVDHVCRQPDRFRSGSHLPPQAARWRGSCRRCRRCALATPANSTAVPANASRARKGRGSPSVSRHHESELRLHRQPVAGRGGGSLGRQPGGARPLCPSVANPTSSVPTSRRTILQIRRRAWYPFGLCRNPPVPPISLDQIWHDQATLHQTSRTLSVLQ
jgi:hypothetical protein